MEKTKEKDLELENEKKSLDDILKMIDEDELIELINRKEDLDEKEKKIFIMNQLIKKKEAKLNEREDYLNEKVNEINKEKDLLIEREINIRKECDERTKRMIDDTLNRNEELAHKLTELSRKDLEYGCLKNELDEKENLINDLKSELYECKTKLSQIEESSNLENIELIKEKAKRVEEIDIENRRLIKENRDLNEKNSALELQIVELEILKNNKEILSNKLNRSQAYIKYLKKIEESKGIGDDTSQIIFNEIIKKQEDMDKETYGENYLGDDKFIDGFIEYCETIGYTYDKNLIRSFLCSLRSSKLTILKGYSGTGKSSLPILFSKYLKGECVVIPIQPNWRTKQDIIGFYNYFTNKFIPTELTQTLIRANVSKDRIFIVVLDEMNLARVEYYFSEFNSKLWMDYEKRKIELFDGATEYSGKVSSYIKENKIQIPENIFFVGTINEDDSVSPISDKIFDRAQVVEFMELPSSKSEGNLDLANENLDASKYTKYSSFIKVQEKNDENINIDIIDEVNKFTKENFNKVIGYRSLNQVKEFIKNFKNSGGSEIDAIDIQLVSKFIPKLKYLYSNDQIESLELFNEYIKELFKKYFNCDEKVISNLNIINQIEAITKELNE